MIQVSEEQRRLIEETKNLQTVQSNKTNILTILYPQIYSLWKKGVEIQKIYEFVEEITNIGIHPKSFRRWVNTNIGKRPKKFKPIKEIKMAKIIAVVNFKGGVGKSTIANILKLDNKVVINLDDAQDAQKINYTDTYNFSELKEEYGVETVEEAIDGAIESGKESIVIDTPGEIEEFIELLPKVDFFIVPFTPGERSIQATITTIETIDAILDADETIERKDKWLIVLNKYNNDEQLKELDKVFIKAKAVLGEKEVHKAELKYSAVIPTIERRQMSIDELVRQNAIAYGAFKKRVKALNKIISKIIAKEQ